MSREEDLPLEFWIAWEWPQYAGLCWWQWAAGPEEEQ